MARRASLTNTRKLLTLAEKLFSTQTFVLKCDNLSNMNKGQKIMQEQNKTKQKAFTKYRGVEVSITTHCLT